MGKVMIQIKGETRNFSYFTIEFLKFRRPLDRAIKFQLCQMLHEVPEGADGTPVLVAVATEYNDLEKELDSAVVLVQNHLYFKF